MDERLREILNGHWCGPYDGRDGVVALIAAVVERCAEVVEGQKSMGGRLWQNATEHAVAALRRLVA